MAAPSRRAGADALIPTGRAMERRWTAPRRQLQPPSRGGPPNGAHRLIRQAAMHNPPIAKVGNQPREFRVSGAQVDQEGGRAL